MTFDSFKHLSDDDFDILAGAIEVQPGSKDAPQVQAFWRAVHLALEVRNAAAVINLSELYPHQVESLRNITAKMRNATVAKSGPRADFWNDIAALLDEEDLDRKHGAKELERFIEGHEPESGEWTADPPKE